MVVFQKRELDEKVNNQIFAQLFLVMEVHDNADNPLVKQKQKESANPSPMNSWRILVWLCLAHLVLYCCCCYKYLTLECLAQATQNEKCTNKGMNFC